MQQNKSGCFFLNTVYTVNENKRNPFIFLHSFWFRFLDLQARTGRMDRWTQRALRSGRFCFAGRVYVSWCFVLSSFLTLSFWPCDCMLPGSKQSATERLPVSAATAFAAYQPSNISPRTARYVVFGRVCYDVCCNLCFCCDVTVIVTSATVRKRFHLSLWNFQDRSEMVLELCC